jgi:hypothetical protein
MDCGSSPLLSGDFDESCHAGLDPASISLEGALRAPPWIAGQARNDIDIDLPKAREIIERHQQLGRSMRALLRTVVDQVRNDRKKSGGADLRLLLFAYFADWSR